MSRVAVKGGAWRWCPRHGCLAPRVACSGRCLFLCCVAAAATMLLLYVGILDAWHRRDHESGWRRRLLVSTAGCLLPAMEARSAAVLPFLGLEPVPDCMLASPPAESNATHIWSPQRRQDCCLALLLPKPPSDCAYTLHEQCTPLPAAGLRLADAYGHLPEFVRVACPGEPWQDLHAFVPLKAASAYNCSAHDGDCSREAPDDSVSVLMLGLDTVSRLNFHRQMPLTVDTLRQLGAIEMLGYNKVADNTFPNLAAVLSGSTERELRQSCWHNSANTFDPCPWLWKNYSLNEHLKGHGLGTLDDEQKAVTDQLKAIPISAFHHCYEEWKNHLQRCVASKAVTLKGRMCNSGHRTMFIEDAPFLGTFHHHRPGFSKPPTDYYPRPYMCAVDREMGHYSTGTLYRCAGKRLQASLVLAYVRKFVQAMGAAGWRYWALAWTCSATHDRLNGPQLLDRELSQLLRGLADSGALRRTVLMLLSDHGIRLGAFRQTRQGQLEARLPLLSVVLPAWFSTRYPTATRNLRSNARRLCTPFDLHRTLLDLVRPDRTLLTPSHTGAGRGRSLFSALSEWRTCADAGVSPHWCACQRDSQPMPAHSALAQAAARRFVRQLNARLAPLRAPAARGAGEAGVCAPLRLRRVLSALRSPRDVTVILETAPGGARFEATLALDDGGSGEDATLDAVSRVNPYGNQSACISDVLLKPFCYCVS